ncbi:MAG TPA: metallopeptidase [Porticoccaceae bacterium]|nr:metallopeptidase [Porticoccaceae bacterium]HCO59434.1 metallopeptidase [Porticoccaceae bacterium]
MIEAGENTTELEPIDGERRALVVAETARYVRLAAELYQQPLPMLPVCFDLLGRASGMYKIKGEQRWFRYNPYIFALNFEEHLLNTVAHEVAHYVVDCRHGLVRVKPHGAEWRGVMEAFGVEASRTFDHSLAGVPQRSYRQVSYRCDCGEQPLGIRRHNKVMRAQARYRCRVCDVELRPV